MNCDRIFFALCFILIFDLLIIEACTTNEWSCRDGSCIDEANLCDGAYNCVDKSDESPEICFLNPCPTYAFRCSYGGCIAKFKICDGKKDCTDGSDELKCLGTSLSNNQSNACDDEYDFMCTSGECISNDKICDGLAHCEDKSDETLSLCHNFECPSYAFVCAYGGCVPKSARCNRTIECADGSDEFQCKTYDKPVPGQDNQCIVPTGNGLYAVNILTNATLRAGQIMKNNNIYSYKCPKNHLLIGSKQTVCANGRLSTDDQSTCTKYCTKRNILSRISTKASCFLNKYRITCSDNILPGTIASIECKIGYSEPPNQVKTIACRDDGQWDRIPYACDPVCGEAPDPPTPFIFEGEEIKIEKVPWQAALYRKDSLTYDHKCGGTILNAKVVVTAAHCVWDRDNNKPYNKKRFTVGVGKTNRNFYSKEIENVPQFFNVSEIRIAPDFQGVREFYRDDIAILILNNPIIFENHIKPICYEHSNKLADNTLGRISGYGIDESGDPSKQLKSVELFAISENSCKKIAPKYSEYISKDKFCVKSNEYGQTLCEGDSGGGFIVKKGHKYYLRGIVSNGLRPPNVPCGSEEGVVITAFTNIDEHFLFIAEAEIQYREK